MGVCSDKLMSKVVTLDCIFALKWKRNSNVVYFIKYNIKECCNKIQKYEEYKSQTHWKF